MEMKIGPLEVQEIKEAKLMWIKSAKRGEFPADVCNLTDGLKTLTPFLDESNISRVDRRLDRAAACYDAKHPIIIPQGHQPRRLVIMDSHKKLNHEGTAHVRNDFRLLYWIPRF